MSVLSRWTTWFTNQVTVDNTGRMNIFKTTLLFDSDSASTDLSRELDAREFGTGNIE